ncbi:MFS transporter [Erwinia sp. E_sp_B01_9]|uniref:MFS transporter n=1 Tax=Erwinia sp. E_sp_B01_9 TaxID=3039403 RepID=UPI003D9ACC14
MMKSLSAAGVFTLLAIACLTIMVGCVIVPGLPSVAAHLGVASAVGWLITLPSLGVVIFGPIAAKVIERYGLYRSLVLGLFSYGALGTVGAFLTHPALLFTDRFLLGGSTALVMSGGTGLLSSFFTGEQRLKMIARQGMSIELGGVIFLFFGGILASAGWRWPFSLYLVAWLFLLMLVIFVPRPDRTNERTTEGSGEAASPLMKPIYAAALFSMVCFFTAVIVLPMQLHSQGFSEAETGYFLAFISLMAVIAAWAMPRVVKVRGEFGTLYLAFLAYAAAHLLLAFATGPALLVVAGVLMGSGFGLSVPLVNHMVVEHSPVGLRGQHLAYLSMAIFLGQFLSSFMEFIPGNRPRIFLGAAALAVVVTALLWRWHAALPGEKQESEALP